MRAILDGFLQVLGAASVLISVTCALRLALDLLGIWRDPDERFEEGRDEYRS